MDEPTGAKYGIAFSEWHELLIESSFEPLCPAEVMRVYIEQTALDIYKVRQSLQLSNQHLIYSRLIYVDFNGQYLFTLS